MTDLLNAVRWIDLASVNDQRGVLTSIEAEQDIPFAIQRVFYMHHITANRGGHAHRDTEQIVIATAGWFSMALSDGHSRQVYTLDNPQRGIYIPPMVFIELYDFSPQAVCLVLASTHYDMARSIRTWADYLHERQIPFRNQKVNFLIPKDAE